MTLIVFFYISYSKENMIQSVLVSCKWLGGGQKVSAEKRSKHDFIPFLLAKSAYFLEMEIKRFFFQTKRGVDKAVICIKRGI